MMRNDFETILLEAKGHTALMTLNRPEAMNSYTGQMHLDMHAAWDEINNDDDIYTVVVVGAGRAFCSGADMKERSRGQVKGGLGREQEITPKGQIISSFYHDYMRGTGVGLPRPHWGYPGKPMIAAIHGICCGDGIGWLYGSDFAICSDDATFFDPHVNVGAHPTSISNCQRMVATPMALAIELLGLPWRVSAKRAYQVGLVTEVVPREQLWERALEIAEEINRAPNNRLPARASKALWWGTAQMNYEEARLRIPDFAAGVRILEAKK